MKNYRWHLLVCLFLAGASALTAGELRQQENGDFQYTAPGFQARLSASGRWISLKVNDLECLAADQDALLKKEKLQLSAHNTLEGSEGDLQVKISFDDEKITIEPKKGKERLIYLYLNLADHFSYAVMPREGGNTLELPVRGHADAGSGRLISTRGPALDLNPRVQSGRERAGRRISFVVWMDKQEKAIIRPLARADAADLIFFNYSKFPPHHFFAAGKIELPVVIRNRGTRPAMINCTVELKNYHVNKKQDVLETSQQKVAVPAGDQVRAGYTFGEKEPLGPGPYAFSLRAEFAGKLIKQANGVIMLAPEKWQLTDCRPADFDEFWAQALREARAIPFDAQMADKPTAGLPDCCREFSIAGLGHRRVRGFIGFPKLAPGQKAPVMFTFPGAGYAAGPLDGGLAANGWVIASISVHDLPFASNRYHAEEYNDKPYNNRGADDREQYFYRFAYANCARVVDWLRSRPEVDPARIVLSGGSQGGQLTLATASLVPEVALALVNVPGGGRLDLMQTEHKGWMNFDPPAGLSSEQMFRRTLAYFDTYYHAGRIRCPILFSIGLCDNVIPGAIQYQLYRQVKNSPDARLVVDAWGGHGVDGAFIEKDQREMIKKYIGK